MSNKELQLKNHTNTKKLLKNKLFLELFGEQPKHKERLILGTCMQESRYIYRFQLGDGPARGFGQIEPDTAFDIFKNYLSYRKSKLNKVLECLPNGFDYNNRGELSKELAYNDLFNLIMLRFCYYRISESIPKNDDGIAKYWKKYYNTELGAGTVKEFIHSLDKLDRL